MSASGAVHVLPHGTPAHKIGSPDRALGVAIGEIKYVTAVSLCVGLLFTCIHAGGLPRFIAGFIVK